MCSKYRTSQIAQAVGVHPNTIRLYEQWGYLETPPRSPKGYRQYTEAHLEQMRLARLAFVPPYPGGKAPVEALVRLAAQGDLPGALAKAETYLVHIQAEQAQAEAAVTFLEQWAIGTIPQPAEQPLQIREAAALLQLTPDVLRNWERNGLVKVPRHPRNRYRLYSASEIGRLHVIRLLRCAGYSPMAILRMLIQLDQGHTSDLRAALDTPRPEDDVYFAADHWLSALKAQSERAQQIITRIRMRLDNTQW